MSKLKRIIIEGLEKIDVPAGEVPTDVAFTLSERDPWEYKVDTGGTIYTRKKGESKWKSMKDVAANFDLAKQRIANMDKFKSSGVADTKTETEPKPDGQPVQPENIKSLANDFKIQTNIAKKLFDMITKHPEKYFKRFRGVILPDNELGAANAFKKFQDMFVNMLDTMIVNKKDSDISLNTKVLKTIMNSIYKSIKNNVQIKKSIQLVDPSYKSTNTHERYKTHTTLIWWQYFNN